LVLTLDLSLGGAICLGQYIDEMVGADPLNQICPHVEEKSSRRKDKEERANREV